MNPGFFFGGPGKNKKFVHVLICSFRHFGAGLGERVMIFHTTG
ncbi:hypothetical protein DCCM_2636 [Desulfocucumis palustris]|uniref:Uncharacterized protein n=1 Tax=Desulfocucumis palustris TaxID=1898651 RepID=A0A2L2XC13_9FIRM|nr:hypothetical protein DCCM_2636 [Desulfocucumis palustris]